MQTRTVIRPLAVLMVALSLAGTAWAGGGRHSGYPGAYHEGHGGKHYGYRQHGGNYRGYSRKYVTKYVYDDNYDGENLLVGLLVGGLVGYAFGDAHHQAAAGGYYPPASTGSREVYTTAQYPEPGTDAATTCLQEREYQNKVIVGGKTVDAYGTACLQPDGSWRYGPARLASF